MGMGARDTPVRVRLSAPGHPEWVWLCASFASHIEVCFCESLKNISLGRFHLLLGDLAR